MRPFTRCLLMMLGYTMMAILGVFLLLAGGVRFVFFWASEAAEFMYGAVECALTWVCIWDQENRQ